MGFRLLVHFCGGDGEVDEGQHGKNRGLDNADEEFHEQKRKRYHGRNEAGHNGEQHFAGEDISVQPEGKTNHFRELSDEFDEAHEQFDDGDNDGDTALAEGTPEIPDAK